MLHTYILIKKAKKALIHVLTECLQSHDHSDTLLLASQWPRDLNPLQYCLLYIYSSEFQASIPQGTNAPFSLLFFVPFLLLSKRNRVNHKQDVVLRACRGHLSPDINIVQMANQKFSKSKSVSSSVRRLRCCQISMRLIFTCICMFWRAWHNPQNYSKVWGGGGGGVILKNFPPKKKPP